ncbi:DNA mismatch repair protein MutL [Chelonobacter oris]|uniref:DNA mismatch repair protein MutL n=1 Tax=Chelonobacter oris TaxID=505317 RepID=A0A0A3AV01_9PAST|nr:DNA mismatch repair endonuclease MutL [Chelonobacter oris]KGQ70935.1 DNA mismatch repair protein MutL [Chelonobacter oris]
MPIQILSPQLTNQIAAGEVVERPASVVKELIENSLDAGADEIQIDIEQGGAGLIRIRDNGFGIPKEELALALSRHATSKISTLEDLEAILSLGFRGEALASISSVSRLLLTSKPAQQTEAWQVFAQGRDMETTLQPAAHPVGTTVEVANLFFNTPARRKFLRTEKTEFAHIDEVVRRIALVKSQASFTLTHNGKIVRQYRKVTTEQQKLKRLAAICGQDFVSHSLEINWQHNELHLYGWVADSRFLRTQNDLNYSYVNGRMMRDKTINHAVRQAYGDNIQADTFPAFVLFIDLDPTQVDVNVHPAKHEVRFHQNRLVHDFIYQGVLNALQSVNTLDFEDKRAAVPPSNRTAAGENIFAAQTALSPLPTISPLPSRDGQNFTTAKNRYRPPEGAAYGELLRAPQPAVVYYPSSTAGSTDSVQESVLELQSLPPETTSNPHLRLLTLLSEEQLILLQRQQSLYLLAVKKLQHCKLRQELQQTSIPTQPLLIPLVIHLNDIQKQNWQTQQPHFVRCGFDIACYEQNGKSRLTLNAVPMILRQQNLQACLVGLLNNSFNDFEQFLSHLIGLLNIPLLQTQADATAELARLEQLISADSPQFKQLLMPLDLQPYLQDMPE